MLDWKYNYINYVLKSHSTWGLAEGSKMHLFSVEDVNKVAIKCQCIGFKVTKLDRLL